MTRRSDNGAVEKLSQFLTSQHLRQLKFVGVVTVMTLLCGIFLWYLFAPKPAPQQAGTGGYNVTIPEATVKPAETDKRKVYEQEQYEQQRREKLQSLGDVMDDRLPVTGEMADATVPAAPTAIDESDAAYRRISGEMAAFYTPAPSCGNTEVEALKEQVAALQSQLTTPSGSSPIRWNWPRSSTSSHGSISAAERPRTKRPGRRSSEGICVCPSCSPFGRVRSKPRHSIRGRISPSNVTWDFSRQQVMSRMPTFRLSGLVSLRRKSYVPEAPCNCGCWKPCVSTE